MIEGMEVADAIVSAKRDWNDKPRDPQRKRVRFGEEEQGSQRSFRRQAETELSRLCDDEGAYRFRRGRGSRNSGRWRLTT